MNGRELSWSMSELYSDSDIVVRPMIERDETVTIELNDVSIVVNRHFDSVIGNYLGVYLRSSYGLSSDVDGIIGKIKL